jgi:hypothetical protein
MNFLVFEGACRPESETRIERATLRGLYGKTDGKPADRRGFAGFGFVLQGTTNGVTNSTDLIRLTYQGVFINDQENDAGRTNRYRIYRR